MFHDNRPARVAGPFGYTQRNLATLTPGERAEMRRELDALDNKLQWGFEPDRWAKGAAWHGDDWPEAKLLGGGELAGGFDRRDDLIAEADDFRATLDGADKAWKTQAGRDSPFLPALAAWPQHRREQMRERSKAIRDLVAFGETPERWARGIEFMRDDLRDPQADTGRLVALHGQRHDLLPAIDAMDHALDYLDEVDAEAGAESPDTPPIGNASGGYTPLPEQGPTGPQGNGTDGNPRMSPGREQPDDEYPPEGWVVPMPHIERPEDEPSRDSLVTLLSNTETGDSSASTQPAGGSAGGSSTGGPTLTGPGGEGQGSETPAPAPGKLAPDVNPHADEAAERSRGGAGSRPNADEEIADRPPDRETEDSGPAVEDTQEEIPAIEWKPVQGLVTKGKTFNTNGPVRVELNSMTLGLDGMRYTVDWHPLDKNGNRETVVQSEDYRAPEYGGLVLPGVPSETIIEPPFDHPYGFEVTVRVPPQPGYSGNSARPYLNIYRSK